MNKDIFKCPKCGKNNFRWDGIHKSNEPVVSIKCKKCNIVTAYNYETGKIVEW